MLDNRLDELVPVGEGLPSTPSTRYLAQDAMLKRGFNPIDRMIDLAEDLEQRDRELDIPVNAELRLKVYSNLAKYFAPQPKSMDINIQSSQHNEIRVVSFNDLYNDRKSLIPAQAIYTGPQLTGVVERPALEVVKETE